jgi:hypothetical protein
MTPADFIKEHKRLVKILRTGSKAQRLHEAKGQSAELKKYLITLNRKK